jgi:glucokinase
MPAGLVHRYDEDEVPTRRVGIGADLGGTNARAAVVDRATGAILTLHRDRLGERSPEAVAEVVAHVVREAAREAGMDVERLGLGVAGQCLGATGVVLNAPNLGWRDVGFGSMVSRELGAPVRLVNDLSAAAWGERKLGAAKGIDEAALVFVGTGVGSALVFGGRLYEGARGLAGELGHTKVRAPRGGPPRLCGCGQRGCLEAYAGGSKIAERVREELTRGASSIVAELVKGNLGEVTPSVVDRAAAAGDLYARELWNEVGDLLGTAIANLITVLNPARVILGGGVILGCPELEKLVRLFYAERVSRSAMEGVEIVPAELGDDAGVVGAALLD